MAIKPHSSIRHLEMPGNIRELGLNDAGWPRLFFAAKVDGVIDLRIMDPEKFRICVTQRRCWICGKPLGKFMAFVAGPMCILSRTSAEPPSHYGCAYYAVQACPFLTRPTMRRREAELPEIIEHPAGIMLERNPGVTAILVTTKGFDVWHPRGGGVLITMGKPDRIEWYCAGRHATRAEVTESIRTGLPALEKLAREDRDPIGALAELSKRQCDVMEQLPA